MSVKYNKAVFFIIYMVFLRGVFMNAVYTYPINKEPIYIGTYIHTKVEPHKHKFLELVYILDGSAIHTRDGIQTKVSAGDYFIVDFNSYHMYKSKNPITLINCLFMPEFIDNTLAGCNSLATVLNNYLIRFNCGIREYVTSVFHDDTGEIKHLIVKLMNEFAEKKSGYLELMRCTLIEIIINMMRCTAAPTKRTEYKPHIYYIMDYINKNYNKDISLSFLANEMHYTVSHLSHMFSEYVGMGFNKYLQKTRLEHACHLLANTNLKISEIAEAVGIFDTNYFRELFKRHFGISPTLFKKNLKQH